MKIFFYISFVVILLNNSLYAYQGDTCHIDHFEIIAPSLVLSGIPFKLEATVLDGNGQIVTTFNENVQFENIQPSKIKFQDGKLIIEDAVVENSSVESIAVKFGNVVTRKEIRAVPGLLSILPPLLAILFALLIREVIISLFAGVWLGAFIIFNYDFFGGLLRVIDHFVINAIASTSHVQIIVFSLLFGGMVGVISKNGGSLGIANLVIKFAKNPKRGQLSTWGLSFLFFFDDYANVLIRGNLMRPITDKLLVSREKLSFIVDAGAATVASIFIISTWIGYEVGLIEQGLK
ncbi:MAG: Na+/H+ antiporter NhaC family protein, partial [Bacteroidetes bacterium]|nr:Na+/H+ antiporter NhaC family protein [Bacteroidota bacterium]